MTNRAKILLPLAALAVGVVAAALIVKARPAVERQTPEVPPPLVRVVEAERTDHRLVVRSSGTVAPRVDSSLVAEVAGRIERTAPEFARGGFVRRGQVLVEIDSRDYELAVEQAAARVAQAEVRLELERAEAELARSEWRELGDGEPSPLTVREPQLAEAQAALEGARAAHAKARLDLERTAVRAPFDGRIRDKLADVGRFVAPGTPLATLYSTDAAEIELPVPRADLAFLDLDLGRQAESGPPVVLRAELGGASRSWPARIVRTGGGFDVQTRMLPLYARIDDPFALADEGRAPLPMGLFVDAEITGRVAEGAVVLPRVALRESGEVLVVDDESRLRIRPVEVLRRERERVVLAGGIEAGELVCVSPIEAVVDGMRVRTVVDDGGVLTDAAAEERL